MNNNEEERVVEPGEQTADKLIIQLEINEFGDVNFGASHEVDALTMHFYLSVAAQKVMVAHLGHVHRLMQLSKTVHVPNSPGLILPS